MQAAFAKYVSSRVEVRHTFTFVPAASALDRLDHLNYDRDQQVERFDDDLAAQIGAERARE